MFLEINIYLSVFIYTSFYTQICSFWFHYTDNHTITWNLLGVVHATILKFPAASKIPAGD